MTSSFSAERRRPQIGLGSLRLESAGRQRERHERGGPDGETREGSPEKGKRWEDEEQEKYENMYREEEVASSIKQVHKFLSEKCAICKDKGGNDRDGGRLNEMKEDVG